ncbi:MAG: hypothetical protein ACO4B4_13855, partial [Planctomycetota bacterium]
MAPPAVIMGVSLGGSDHLTDEAAGALPEEGGEEARGEKEERRAGQPAVVVPSGGGRVPRTNGAVIMSTVIMSAMIMS